MLLKPFDELTPAELYRIIQLRNEVFVVEQNCVFQDADGKDPDSWHLMGFDKDQLIAYTRLLPPGIAYEYPSIGRVVSSPAARRTGAGREIMKRSIEAVYELFGSHPIQIGAQLYLEKFYNDFGFERCSEIYLEDGIQHISMIKKPTS